MEIRSVYTHWCKDDASTALDTMAAAMFGGAGSSVVAAGSGAGCQVVDFQYAGVVELADTQDFECDAGHPTAKPQPH